MLRSLVLVTASIFVINVHAASVQCGSENVPLPKSADVDSLYYDGQNDFPYDFCTYKYDAVRPAVQKAVKDAGVSPKNFVANCNLIGCNGECTSMVLVYKSEKKYESLKGGSGYHSDGVETAEYNAETVACTYSR